MKNGAHMNSMVSPLAVVEADRIGDNVVIREYAIVRRGAVIGITSSYTLS